MRISMMATGLCFTISSVLYAAEPTPVVLRSPTGLPRKVVVGTVIRSPWAGATTLEGRLNDLGALIDQVAQQAKTSGTKRAVDLIVLPEQAVTRGDGTASERSAPLEGNVRDTFAAKAKAHDCYLVVPMELAETLDGRPIFTNTAVLFDRKGEVAGIYRKVHPVAPTGSDELERGMTPGWSFPVFDCDFGRLGIQICWDVVYDDGWKALADAGAEIVVWPTASPATVRPARHAETNRYYVVSSTFREDATVFEPTGMVAAQIEGSSGILIHELDLSYAILNWSANLRDGNLFKEKFGERVGFHYSRREDTGLFWSNDPTTPIASMLKTLGLEETRDQASRNGALQDRARPTHPVSR